jgi:hypothetical protein
MKKIALLLLGVFFATVMLQACSDKLCPAYSSYREGKKRRA